MAKKTKKTSKKKRGKTAKKSTRKKSTRRPTGAGGSSTRSSTRSSSGASSRALSPGGTLKAPVGGVKIRMYRQGFGDCFLLAFGGTDGGQQYVMIDMGVVNAAAGKPELMNKIAKSIREATNDHIDVLVVTHEHYDHVCGFKFANAELSKITFDVVWLAWTQDPKDELAKSLHEDYGQQLKALHAAAVGMKAAADDAGETRLKEFLSFDGDFLGATEKFSPTTKEAMGLAVKLAAKAECWKPGKVIDDAIDGVRVYVLGPPRDKDALKQTEPAPGEVYLTDQAAMSGFVGALLTDGSRGNEATSPFEPAYAIDEKRARRNAFFAHGYFGTGESEPERAKKLDWRRIDASWLRFGEALALQMQNATNNTSLVLAFEHVKSGRVLLFAGDAQPGNWRTWSKVRFRVDAGATKLDRDGDGVVTSDDLLAATLVYKVGHHGSHNGTLRAEGLEKMTSRDLIALLPTDKDQAVKSGWDAIPKAELVDRLRHKAEGRVLSSEHTTPRFDASTPPDEASSQAAWAAFVATVAEPSDRMSCDLTLDL